MAENDIRRQEINRQMAIVDPNIEKHQAMVLEKKNRGIKTAHQNASVTRIINIFYYLAGALELLLLVRVILHLIGTDPNGPFASFINGLSYPFVAFFETLLQNPDFGARGVLEISTIIAMLIWGSVAWMIGYLTRLVLSRTR